jgi:hypothetical protein
MATLYALSPLCVAFAQRRRPAAAVQLSRLSAAGALAALRAMPPQPRLDLSRCSALTNLGAAAAAVADPALLTFVSLSGHTGITGEQLRLLLAAAPGIRSLDLSHSSAADTAAEALDAAPRLTRLSLAHARVTPGGLVRALRACPELSDVDLRGCTITPIVASTLASHTSLRAVDLTDALCPGGGAGFHFGPRAALETFTWLRAPVTGLRIAAPRLTALALDGSAALAALYLGAPALRSLSLAKCTGLTALALMPYTVEPVDWAGGGAGAGVVTIGHAPQQQNRYHAPISSADITRMGNAPAAPKGPTGLSLAAGAAAGIAGGLTFPALLPALRELSLRGVHGMRGVIDPLWRHTPALRSLNVQDSAVWGPDLDSVADRGALPTLLSVAISGWDELRDRVRTRVLDKIAANKAAERVRLARLEQQQQELQQQQQQQQQQPQQTVAAGAVAAATAALAVGAAVDEDQDPAAPLLRELAVASALADAVVISTPGPAGISETLARTSAAAPTVQTTTTVAAGARGHGPVAWVRSAYWGAGAPAWAGSSDAAVRPPPLGEYPFLVEAPREA